MKKFITFILLLLCTFIFISCGKKQEEIKTTGLTIKLSDNQIEIDETVTAKALFTPSDATDIKVNWSSSDTEIATVKNGKITGIAEGTCVISCVLESDNNIKDSITITVIEKQEETDEPTDEPTETKELTIVETIYCENVQFIGVTKTEYYVFDTVKFTYVLNNSDANRRPTNTSVTYSSSDEEVATVSEDGTISFLSAGEVVIRITANGVEEDKVGTVYDEVTLTVLEVVNPTKIEASVLNEILEPGYGTKINVSVEPANGDKRVTYQSSNENILQVDDEGNITTFIGVTGNVVITVISVADPTIFTEIDILVEKVEDVLFPESIEIKGETKLYVGDAYGIRLSAVVLPATAYQGVTWSSSDESIAIVDSTGYVVGVSAGSVRIRATSTIDEDVKSKYYNITVYEYVAYEPVDLKGYEIIMMIAASALGDLDPFVDTYTQSDKSYKQAAWRETETNFNCTIKVEPYPDEVPWGQTRINWLVTNAANNASATDFASIESSWIYNFVNASAIVDLTDYYDKYGESQMENALKEAGSYNNKLYLITTGISPTASYVGLGLYYNMHLLETINVEDPATMFNEGRWTYSNFMEWVRTAQAQLGDSEETGYYALTGHPLFWWFGMTNAAGVKVCDTTAFKINLSTQKSKDAAAMYYTLSQEGCIDKVNTSVEYATDGNAWYQGKAILTSGEFWFVRGNNRWYEGIFGDDTRFGYVPFPYPDGMDKEQTRLSKGGYTSTIMMAGRNYPAGIAAENIFQCITTMYLDTIKKQKADPLFDADQVMDTQLLKKIDNPESIKAIKFYTADKVFFDPALDLYQSSTDSPLKYACISVMREGKDYDEIFASYYTQLEQDFKKIYAY